VPSGMHQKTRAGATIAATTTDLLIEAIQRLRQGGVQHCTDVVLVDAKSEGGGGDHAIEFIGRPGSQQLFTLGRWRASAKGSDSGVARFPQAREPCRRLVWSSDVQNERPWRE